MNSPNDPIYDADIKKLVIRGAQTVPNEIFDTYPDVEILDLSYGNLRSLPDDFSRLANLKVLFLSNNDFEEIPAVLANCKQLIMLGMRSCKISRLEPNALPISIRTLIFTDNQIPEIPASIKNLKNLQKLAFTGNHIAWVSDELLQCKELKLIRFSANKLAELPTWILEHPNLAWYTTAGNPGSLTSKDEDVGQRKTYQWSDITVGDKLGESVKNVVYAATLNETGENVALKLFGTDLSADGFSRDEIDVSLALRPHPNIAKYYGTVPATTDQKEGMIMSLVPAHYHDLGQIPNFTTQIRDTYPPDTQFSTDFVLTVLKGIASALQSLHSQNIMHGDLYAHNILVNDVGMPYLTDFGAASFYAPLPDKRHERMEVKAFGHLVDELTQKVPITDGNTILDSLSKLKEACLRGDTKERPTFTEISEILANL